MKVYLMTDMEGVCGIIDFDEWVMPTGRYYEEGKKLLTMEVNAAVEGFFNAGADEVVVVDGHCAGGINLSLLDSRTTYIRSLVGYPFSLSSEYDAMAWVGQHAKAGTEYAHIAHTIWFDVLEYKINGISVGEFGQMAMVGAFLGVRSIFGSGDEAFAYEAKQLVQGIETVSVKKGLTPGNGDEYDCEGYRNRNVSAMHLHPLKARELIQAGAEKSLLRFKENREDFKLIPLKMPFRKEIKYRTNGKTPSYRAFADHANDIIRMMNLPAVKMNLP